MRAIDISFPQIGQAVTPDWWTQLKSDGWGLAIIGLWGGVTPNTEAAHWLADAREAGLLTACYFAINGGRPGGWHYDQARRYAGDEWEHCLFCAVDVEVDGITLDNVTGAIDALQAALKPPLLYTGEWFWDGHLHNPTAFANVPLWTAQYDGVAVLDSAQSYGGWSPAGIVGKQYSGTGQLHGVTCDLSVFSDDWLASLRATPATSTRDTLAALSAAFDALWRKPYLKTRRTVYQQLQKVAPQEMAAVASAYQAHSEAVGR